MASEKTNPPTYDQIHEPTPSSYPHPGQSNAPASFNMQSQPTTIMVTSPLVGPDPTTMVCPSCRATIVTRLEYETTTKTHICAGLLCLFICWPCVCIPYCSTSCRDANHYCPNCGTFIGTYRK